MATPSKVSLSVSELPEFYLPGLMKESAQKASELLQENHEQHHIFFRQDGFHNHIAHHLLTLYALNASPSILQKHYDDNKSYQRPTGPVEESVVHDMHDPSRFASYLGKEKYYHDFLVFFQDQMEKKGWQAVVNEYLFKGDERADDLLVRLYAGFLHPIIHLGFGVEFHQPAIVAEALAQAAVHGNWMGPLLLAAEEKAASQKGQKKSKSLVELLDAVRANEKVRNAAHWDDGNKVRDGIMKSALDEVVDLASQWTVAEDELEKKTAEMINAAVYFTACAQHPPNVVKFDFYFIHCLNSSIFFSAFLKQPWLSTASKIRLLEWKGRNDIVMYASRRAPNLLLDEVKHYTPKRRDQGWDEVFDRVQKVDDDGHAAKLVRALAHGERVCRQWEERDEEGVFRIKGRDMWENLGHMAVDSVEVRSGSEEPVWVRSAGFEEAWEKVPEREQARL